MKYTVNFFYGEDSFPEAVLETDDLDEALYAAEDFRRPEGWKEDEDPDEDVSICMTVDDADGNTVFWCNTEGECGTDYSEDHPLYSTIEALLDTLQ